MSKQNNNKKNKIYVFLYRKKYGEKKYKKYSMFFFFNILFYDLKNNYRKSHKEGDIAGSFL